MLRIERAQFGVLLVVERDREPGPIVLQPFGPHGAFDDVTEQRLDFDLGAEHRRGKAVQVDPQSRFALGSRRLDDPDRQIGRMSRASLARPAVGPTVVFAVVARLEPAVKHLDRVGMPHVDRRGRMDR